MKSVIIATKRRKNGRGANYEYRAPRSSEIMRLERKFNQKIFFKIFYSNIFCDFMYKLQPVINYS